MRYFRVSLLVAVAGLALGTGFGWSASGTVGGTLATLFIVLVLAVLEVSLSFDNAVVNATVLHQIDAVWRRRFITWGIAIAVFGNAHRLPAPGRRRHRGHQSVGGAGHGGDRP